ncbi:peptidyl-prolyl cis-trans isomerase [Dysgonomonas sp. Marseille-P4677]|uniref:peptidylprolyl isomerase n=1 Tax=Dysgonomonas sp. Marseille-P4677 TaxID=2364790 RepID=UPI001912A899|nr:peptidylprolyl isomerase [Dysgonomonas sp. Marseille-P4677]MBK5719627.1 peptidyl-prolyl cis-trans isomerase [Dysgonomonas sp. Marseille-P4677]
MRKIIFYIFPIFMITTLGSCSKNGTAEADQSQQPIVTVRDKTLYQSDLNEFMPSGLTGEDSIATAKAFIDMWINEQLIYDKAKQNIVNREDIEALVESYRRSLITNTYQEQLLKERFSGAASDSEIKNYYEQNKDKFKLENNIIKGLYLKIPVDSKQLSNFQKWYKQGTEASIENIEKNTLQNAVGYEYFYDRWVGLQDVLENMPPAVTDAKIFLQRNKNLELRDSSFVYLLNIKEYKLEGSEAPYDYIKGQLSDIYIEQRRDDYIKQVRKDLYDKAISNDEIKFYKK